MNNKIIKKLFLFSLLVIILYNLVSNLLYVKKGVEVIEKEKNRYEYQVRFKSERSFGADHFDIYSLTFKNDRDLKEFKPYDKEFDVLFKKFDNVFKSNEVSQELIDEIKEFIKTSDFIYKLEEDGLNQKLFIYNQKLNKGYCLDLVF